MGNNTNSVHIVPMASHPPLAPRYRTVLTIVVDSYLPPDRVSLLNTAADALNARFTMDASIESPERDMRATRAWAEPTVRSDGA